MVVDEISKPLPIWIEFPPGILEFDALRRHFLVLRFRFAEQVPEFSNIIRTSDLDRHAHDRNIIGFSCLWLGLRCIRKRSN